MDMSLIYVSRSMSGHRHKILLVEDHFATRRALTIWLTDLGYDVLPAGSAEEAMKAVEDSTIDLLISDIHLPDGNGLDLIGRLRENQSFPAIAMSGELGQNAGRMCKAAGFDEYFEKPLNIRHLAERVETFVRL